MKNKMHTKRIIMYHENINKMSIRDGVLSKKPCGKIEQWRLGRASIAWKFTVTYNLSFTFLTVVSLNNAYHSVLGSHESMS